MNDKARILIVDNDHVIVNFITTILKLNGYVVLTANTGKEAISIISSQAPDLILLELELPDIDGMEVLRNIRSWSDIPTIILSTQQDESRKVEAFDEGADDYITKPFSTNEFLARIRAELRKFAKFKNNSNVQQIGSTFSINTLKIDYIYRSVFLNGNPIHLTPIEYRILVLLSRNAGKVLTHDYIIREVWGPYGSDRQVLWVNIANIRRKIEPNPSVPRYVLTEVGVGYRMANENIVP